MPRSLVAIGSGIAASVGIGLFFLYYASEQSAEGLYETALSLQDSGQIEAALSKYQEVLEKDPHHLRANNNLAGLLLQKGRFEEAVPHLQLVAESSPDSADPYVNLGYAYLLMKKWARAIQFLERGRHLDPTDHQVQEKLADAYRGFAEQLAKKNDLETAIKKYSQAAWFDPTDPETFLGLGRALVQSGSPNQGLAHLDEAFILSRQVGNEKLASEIQDEIDRAQGL